MGTFFQGRMLTAQLLVGGAVLFSAILTLPRLVPGIPNSIDTTSHLYRVLFMYDSIARLGYVSAWSPEWYRGTAFVLLYPPLGYWIVLALSAVGVTPILAYKTVDAIAFIASPITVYLLCRELDVDDRVSGLSALLFSFCPTVVENYLFYDRFPNILSIPLTCLFMISLLRAAKSGRVYVYTFLSATLFSMVILIHHLSALFTAGLAGLMLSTRIIASWRVDRRFTGVVAASLISGISMAAFWLIPFLGASSHFVTNAFYNRNVDFPFVRLTYFIIEVMTFSLGIPHVLLAAYRSGTLLCGKKFGSTKKVLLPIITLTAAMGLFQLGEELNLLAIKLSGQAVIVVFFIALLLSTLQAIRTNRISQFRWQFLLCWFVIFFWFGLGNYAAPFVELPMIAWLWKRLDVHRFWLFAVVPMSALAASALSILLERRDGNHMKKQIVAISMIAIALVSGGVKGYYSVTQEIGAFLPYSTANSEIPRELIRYFDSDSTYARILAIRCPLWIYLLPHYTGKPLVDGWYPQEKLLDQIMKIDDYRIVDLETAKNESERIKTWGKLIADSDLLAIKWVLVGGYGPPASSLFNGTEYVRDAVFEYYGGNMTVYRTHRQINFFEVQPHAGAKIEFRRPAPDRIILTFEKLEQNSVVTVKEAYYHTWRAISNGRAIDLKMDKTGYITFTATSVMKEVQLYHVREVTGLEWISALSLTSWIVAVVIVEIRAAVGSQGAKKEQR